MFWALWSRPLDGKDSHCPKADAVWQAVDHTLGAEVGPATAWRRERLCRVGSGTVARKRAVTFVLGLERSERED